MRWLHCVWRTARGGRIPTPIGGALGMTTACP
jgi:L-serine deaminase